MWTPEKRKSFINKILFTSVFIPNYAKPKFKENKQFLFQKVDKEIGRLVLDMESINSEPRIGHSGHSNRRGIR